MKKIWVLLFASLLLSSLASVTHAEKGLKVFISVDMEGIAGVVAYGDVSSKGHDYDYFWEVMIGCNVFKTITGLFYPDGTVRRLSEVEAVTGKKPVGFVEKPDSEGVPFEAWPDSRDMFRRAFERWTATPSNDENYHERYTYLKATVLTRPHTFGEKTAVIAEQLVEVDRMLAEGDQEGAFRRIDRILRVAQGAYLKGLEGAQ